MPELERYFSYNVGTEEVQKNFRISASQISRFFDQTSQWYREMLLDEIGFEGSTASELGTIVHAAAAMFYDTGKIDYTIIEKYIDSIPNLEIDKSTILEQYKPMVDTLLTNFLTKTKLAISEEFIYTSVLPGIIVGGSVDAVVGLAKYYVNGNEVDKATYTQAKYTNDDITVKYIGPQTIIDYKTTSSKQPPKVFPRAYWFQLMTYAWVYKQLGVDISTLRLVYVTRNDVGRISDKTGKPLKDYPSQVFTLSEQVTDSGLQLIEGCIKLIADSVDLWQKRPELRYILAQDYRLKSEPKVKPILFKD
jgi:hypothetical protein